MEATHPYSVLDELPIPASALSDQADYIRLVRTGIPGEVVKKAVALLGNREMFVRLLHTSSANLSRFYRRKALDPVATEEVLDVLRLYAEATRIWGDLDSANAWLDTPVAALAGEKPLQLFDTFEGRKWVREVLRKIAFGEFT
ncbi:antitoxin Xre/MbcA/ParS toxin-binding domain-containing protein [Thioalkalivibrio sp.]|uniref:antitoxin Xre/MbcA/ParS toxin-binding domain-containing protein n=1 Tax=Thioalkalivibrio sp. TaxID=2093813 RepID=UPI0039766AE6